jgi:hypothetical protein
VDFIDPIHDGSKFSWKKRAAGRYNMTPDLPSILVAVIQKFYKLNPAIDSTELENMALAALNEATFRVQFNLDDK